MIIKVIYSHNDNKIYFKSKPSHSGRDKQHAVDFEIEPTKEMLEKMKGNNVAYFHAHMKDDALAIDDKIEDQKW